MIALMKVAGLNLNGAAGCVNAGVTALRDSRRFGPLVGRRITQVTYTGRHSGRSFTMPVGYQRHGDIVTIGARLPDSKTWWRNFLGAGGPISLKLDDTERTGHAVARRDEQGRVTVTVNLDGMQS